MSAKLPKALRRSGGALIKQRATEAAAGRCSACSGSGYYDAFDSRGRSIPCGACDGTGVDR